MVEKTFIDKCLAGESVASDIEDVVDAWHDSDSSLELHEYLGLTFDEYAAWIEQPDSLAVIILTKKYRIPFNQAMTVFKGVAQNVG